MKKQYIPKYPIMETVRNDELIDFSNLTEDEINELYNKIKQAIVLCDKVKDRFNTIFGENNG